jgi:hypothetical protein
MSLDEFERHLVTDGMRPKDAAAIRRAAAQLRAGVARAGPKTSECLDEFAVVDFVDGVMNPDDRAAMLVHLASCASCRSEVAALSRLITQPAIRSELERLDTAESRTASPRRFVKFGGIIAAAAAAAVVALLLVPRSPQGEGPAGTAQHRAAVLTLSAPPVTVAPAGPVETPVRFVWTSVPRADRYELTLFDQSGSILWQTESSDTLVVLPDSIALASGASYFWKVEARIDFDRWSESGLAEFTLMTPSDGTSR